MVEIHRSYANFEINLKENLISLRIMAVTERNDADNSNRVNQSYRGLSVDNVPRFH